MNDFSIIIPVYNEEAMLRNQITKLLRSLKKCAFHSRYEILIVENGSTDNTFKIAGGIGRKNRRIRTFHLEKPSYGAAFQQGIQKARYPVIVQFDLDFWNCGFLKQALSLISTHDIVIGSKNLTASTDRRSIMRKIISRTIEYMIRLWFGIPIRDTHGLKVMKKQSVIAFANATACRNHFYDSELLIRAYNAGARFIELPVDLSEIRNSRFPFHVRFIEVMTEFLQLLNVQIETRLKNQKLDHTATYKTAY